MISRTDFGDRLEAARMLMSDFAARTGLTSSGGDIRERYLWTDAFAVQTFFGMTHVVGDPSYHQLALRLIDEVHDKLGRFRPDDEREGWISGLPEEQRREHPTAGGLRIGKQLPERRPDERFDEALEWERDGQYYHYLTRWVQALLQAERETGDERYAMWAADIVRVTDKFIDKTGRRFKMYWKMSTDLSRPLVSSMGAHDPLEGLVCAAIVSHVVPEMAEGLKLVTRALERYGHGRDWSTIDSLGIGGLLLNVARMSELVADGQAVPESISPDKLLADTLDGLQLYAQVHTPNLPAEDRLAFRECGLSLGLRVAATLKIRALDRYMFLADDIESFWMKPGNHAASTWTEHEDINAVTLAASLVAKEHAGSFYAARSPVGQQ